MASLQIDLSGSKGLAARYFGNKIHTAAEPNKLYLGGTGQMAGGVFNPISQLGYMSPANNTTKAVTGTTSYVISSAVTIPSNIATAANGVIYFADDVTSAASSSILALDTLVDTSLSTTTTLGGAPTVPFTASGVAATDVITLVTGNTTNLGIVNGATITKASTSSGISSGTTYYVGSISGETFKIYTDAGLTSLVDISSDFSATSFSRTQTNNYARVDDIILYQINGVPRIFYIKKPQVTEGVGMVIANSSLDFSSTTNSWSASTATGGTYFGMRKGERSVFVLSDNGFLYVLNGNLVHKIDGGQTAGSTGAFTEKVLQFLGDDIGGGTNTITHLIDGMDLRGKMWIGLHVQSSFSSNAYSVSSKTFPMYVGVYIWDKQTTTIGTQSFVEISGAKTFKSIHKFQGVPLCFTTSVDGYTQLRIWNGNSFKIAQTLGKNAYPTNRRHSVFEGDDYIIWLGNDGIVYFYGSFEPGIPNALYQIGDMTSHVTDGQTFSAGGILVPANTTETVTTGNQTEPLAFYVSYTDTAGNHFRKWYPYSTDTVASNAQVGHIGNAYTLVQQLPVMSTLKGIDISCLPNGTSGNTTTVATLKFYANQSTSPFATKTVTRDDISKGYLTYELNKPYVTSFQMEIEWDVSQTLGSNDFCPSYAILEYEPTRTTKSD